MSQKTIPNVHPTRQAVKPNSRLCQKILVEYITDASTMPDTTTNTSTELDIFSEQLSSNAVKNEH